METNIEKVASVGVITRTKNRPQLLRRCIESVLSQTFTDWTHVIVNDGGNIEDLTAVLNSYADNYKNRSVLLSHENSLGMEAASNTGLRRLRTEFVAFLDDDDTWDGEFLAKMIRSLRGAHGDTMMGVVCQTEIIHENLVEGRILEIRREPFNSSLKQISLADLFVENQFTNNSFLFRRSVLDRVGFFDEKLGALGDWDFNLRYFIQFDATILEEILARWHWRGKSASGSEINSVHSPKNVHYFERIKFLNDILRGKRFGDQQGMATIAILGRKLNEIASAIQKVEADRNLLRAEIDRLNAKLNETLRENDGLRNSLSWRITNPLRKIRSFLH